MNIEKQLETAVKTNHLVLVVFYADWSPHYEWIGPVLRTYEKRTVELIRVNEKRIEQLLMRIMWKQYRLSFYCIRVMNFGGR